MSAADAWVVPGVPVAAVVGSGAGADVVDAAAPVAAFEVAAAVAAWVAAAVDAADVAESDAAVVVAFCVVAKATKHATSRRAIDNLVSMVTVSVACSLSPHHSDDIPVLW